jgi:ABC-type transport system involved in multi-copper enzyme maturation permease subunit
MNALTISLAIWGVVVAAFVAIMLYRSYLSSHETDQLYLSEVTPTAGHQENDDVIRRATSIEPVTKAVGGAAILMTLIVAGLWVVQTMVAAHIL